MDLKVNIHPNFSDHSIDFFSAKQITENNIDESIIFPANMVLTVGKPDYTTRNGQFGEGENSRSRWGYFYHEGPEFRVDYIHERVEY